MKKLILLASAAMLAFVACTKKTQEVPAEEITPAQALIHRLASIRDSGLIAFGHHDDLSYGFYWEFMSDSSDVKQVTGDYPAIVNWDLGLVEQDSVCQLDGVPFAYMKEHIRRHHNRGGINTISWHPRNPVTGGNSWDLSGDSVIGKVLTDPALNDTIRTWIGRAADFVASLRDDDGNLIPVVFRPWHEHTGSWFWWCEPFCSPEQYQALWHLTREIFDEKGLNNVVWAYSPDKSNGTTLEQYFRSYPGDEYVDILGADVYHFNGEEGNAIFHEWMQPMLEIATTEAAKRGKIAALTETGSEGCVLDNWYTEVLYPEIKDYDIAYITVWRNAYWPRKAGHFYTPYPGHHATGDFIEFYNLPQTAFLQEIKDIK